MATTIAFNEPRTFKSHFDIELVEVGFVLTNGKGTSIPGRTSVHLRRIDRVAFVTELKGDAFYDETRLDPNEDENDVRHIVAEVKEFSAQQLVVPTDDLHAAAGIAHQVIAGARYNWG